MNSSIVRPSLWTMSESIVIFSSSENAGYPVITHLGISYSGNKYPLSYAGYVTVDVDVYSII